MGLIQPDELKKMIPTLEENISLAQTLLEKYPEDEVLIRLLKNQKATLKDYKERIGISDSERFMTEK